MHKVLSILSFILLFLPAAALADMYPPPRPLPCDECAEYAFRCCNNPPTVISSIKNRPCKHCNVKATCDNYLKKHPGKCKGQANPPTPPKPTPEYDENNLPEPELKDSQVDNSKPIQFNDNPELPTPAQPPVEANPQVPAPAEAPAQPQAPVEAPAQPQAPVEAPAQPQAPAGANPQEPAPANDNAQAPAPTEANPQEPPLPESKKSCSAMMYSSNQIGLIALLTAFLLGILAFVFKRKCR